jgi:PAS domain S-box-containing protein
MDQLPGCDANLYGTAVGDVNLDNDIKAPPELQPVQPAVTRDDLTLSEYRYRLAIEASDSGVWDLDVATRYCYFSPFCLQMLGYELGQLCSNLDDWVNIMHPEDLKNARRVALQCIDGTEPKFQIEFRLKTNRGKWRWFLCKGKLASKDADGRALRVIGTLVDVSESKMVEHILRMEHDLLNLITTTSPVGILFVEGDGHIAFANPRAEQILGLSKKEIMQRGYNSPVWQITTHNEQGNFDAELPLSQVLQAGQALQNRCFSLKRPNGQRALLSVNAAPFLDPAGEIGGTVVILEDVTEQKQHEQVLAESDRLLRETQRIAQLGSYVLDLADDRWSCSSKLLEILGIDASYSMTLMGHFDIVHPEYRRQFMDSYLQSLKKSRTFEMEYKVKRQNDGEERWVAECCELHCDDGGKKSRMIGTIQDITERKAAEEAIRNLNNELDRRVSERTSQLAAAKKEIESFSYSVSHDLRAPLRHINSYSAMLVEDYGDALEPEARDYLERICTASNRMGNLIDDLLTLTRVSRTNMKRQRFNISILAEDVADMLREAEPASPADIVIQKDLCANGDSALIRLVLENLMGNALKYAGRKETVHIEFGKKTVEGKATFFVRDNGVGFDMAYAHNLFQPFQRLHGSEFEGTGIGLATVKKVIERHNGSVWAEGKENEGATFYFTLAGRG